MDPLKGRFPGAPGDRSATWRWTLAWASAFLLAGVLGRFTRLGDPPVATVWPAGGVALLWFLLSRPERRHRIEMPVLAAASLVVNATTGIPLRLAAGFAVATVIHAVVGGTAFRHWNPRSPGRLDDTRGFLALGAAALAGALASAPIGVAFIAVDQEGLAVTSAFTWVLRYAVSSLVVAAFALTWRARLAERRRGTPTPTPASGVELWSMLAVTLVVHTAIFAVRPDEAYAFLALPATVLVALRLGPAWTATHGLLAATFGVVATTLDRGPFAALESPVTRTITVQAFVAVTGLVGLALSFEVRQRHLALRAATRRSDALARTLRTAVVGNALLDLAPGTRGRIRSTNPALERWWGSETDHPLEGRSWRDLLDDGDRMLFDEVLDELADGRIDVWEGELCHRVADGDQRFCQLVAARLDVPSGDTDDDEPVANLQVVDITERKAFEGRLLHQALHDPLTGLPNRNLLQERIGHALASMTRSGRTVALLFFDLDGFKEINDSLGHAAGDEVLITVAARLSQAVRPGDTVARVGGDEFVVCCPDVDPPGHADEIAARLIGAVCRPVTIGDRRVEVSASAGVTLARPGTDAIELLRESDTAMYAAKSAGTGRVVHFSDPQVERARIRPELETELRRAVDEREFVLHYQPIVDIRTGRVDAVEALIRWQHPTRGLLLPADWLPVAETSGLMPELGDRILRDAFAQWPDLARLHGSDVSVHVNVSGSQLRHERFADTVAAALDETGMAGGRVVLELGESQLTAAPDAVLSDLRQIRELGVRLAADDFGTGHSSLTQLTRLPLDELEIGRRIVGSMTTDARSGDLVRAVLAAAAAMGLAVVAKGVETTEEAAMLADAGCLIGQGHLWGPAVEIDLRDAPPLSPVGGRPPSTDRPARPTGG